MKTSVLSLGARVFAILLSSLVHSEPILGAGCPSPFFAPAGTFGAGSQPVFLAVGDFNGDGKPDLVVANQFSADVSVLLGNGDGTFQAAVNYAAGSGPSAVAVRDFNGDGKLDLAVTDVGSTTIWVLLGNGDGTFQAAVSSDATDTSHSVAAGDFNNDGKPDLAVANRSSYTVSVLLGNGNGTFQGPTSYGVGTDPLSVAVGDFNGDGHPDLAVANAALFDDTFSSVSVLLGRANGTFQNAVAYLAGTSPRSVAVGDFNRDGKLDLVVANYGAFDANNRFTNSSVSVLLGNGNGTFQAPVNYAAGEGPLSVVVADFNGDGQPDLAVANYRSGNVSVLFGNSNGTFQPAANYGTAASPSSVAAGEFNADGQLDLALASADGALVLLSTCVIADLSISMTDAPDPVTLGSNLTYTLTVTNSGPDAAPDASVTDRLAAGVSFVSVTSSQGNCTNNSGTINCALGNMTIGAHATITLTVTTTAAGSLTNKATVSSVARPDPNPANNTTAVVTTVLPLVSITATDPIASETGPDPGVFTVSRAGGTAGPLTVNYAVGGSASNGVDYAALSGSVTISNGSASATITVLPVDDLIAEQSETVIVTLSPAAAYTVNVSSSSATVTILDNDVYPLSINDVTVTEGNSGTIDAVFTVSLASVSSQTVTVDFATADGTATAGSDYVATNGTLSFTPGTTNQSVTVRVIGDLLNEANETFFVNLSNPTNARITDGQGVGTINNDDPLPSLSINDVMVPEGTSGSTNAVFTVSLSPVSGQTVTVNFASTDGTASAGSDYAATNGTVTFAPGTTTQTIMVQVFGDMISESNETFFVNLSGPVNASVSNGQGVGTIIDALPAISISDVTVTEGDTGTTNALFTVSLSFSNIQPVTVDFATADGTASAGADYVSTNGTLNFDPGTTNQTITVTVIGDVLNEANETFFVLLSNPTNAVITGGQGMGTIDNDDPLPSLSINDVTVTEGDSGVTHAVFTVSLSAASGQTVTVNFASADGTASAGSDYAATNGTLYFAPGTTTQTITVNVNGDVLNEANETFFVHLSNPTNAVIAGGQGMGTINNDDPLPSLSINDVTVTEGDSGTTNAVFTVSLSAASGQTVTVDFASADGTATAGSDYTATNGTLSFAAGTTARSITVKVNGDLLNELDETFLVNLSSPINAILGDGQGVGTIINDDPLPTLSISDVSVTEGNSGTTNAVFTVSLSAASGQTVTVNYATAAGTATAGDDYVSTNGLLTFAPGTTNQTVTVKVIGDLLNETDETFYLNLSSPTNAILGDSQGLGTINNDDPLPSLSINDVTVSEGNSGTTNAVFTVSLSAASGQSVTVNFATADGTAVAGSDYVGANGTVSLAPGTTNQTLTVKVNGDLLNEANETFVVNLSNPTNATIADGQGVGTINNDDPLPTLSINDVAVTEGNSGTTLAVFTASLSAMSGQTVTVNFATANGTATAGTDYLATNGTVTFAPGTSHQTLGVAVLGDLLSESNETFFVNLTSPTNATLSDSQGVGTIINDDPVVSITISDAAVFEGNSGTTNAVFTVSLSALSGLPVTVSYATANGTAKITDYVNTSGTLSFNPGQTNQFISVPVKGDTTVEANETFFVNLSSPVNATLARGQGVGTILNDDGVPSISISDVTVVEGNSGTTNALFIVALSATNSDVVTVNYTTADGSATAGSDYVATNGLLSFAAGVTKQTITVRVIGDLLNEPNETFFVNLFSSTNALISDGQGVGTIVDDDPLNLLLSTNSVSVPEGNTNSFAVRLSASPASNVIVTTKFTSGDPDLSAGAGTNLTFNAMNWNVHQTVILNAADDDDAIDGQALFTVSAPGLPDATVTAKEIDSDTQALLVSSAQNQGAAPRITAIQLSGADAIISFTTLTSNRYRLERSDEVTGTPWKLAVDNVAGTGGLAQVADRGGAGRARRFYRARLLSVSLSIPEGSSTNFIVQLAAQPTNNVTVTIGRTTGSTNLNVSSGNTLTFTPVNWNVSQTVAINAAEDENTTDDSAIFTVSSAGLTSQTVNVTELDNDLQSFTRCVGDSATFSTTPSGTGPFSYLWRKDGASLVGQTNNSLVLTNMMSGDAGTYSVEVNGASYTVTKVGTLVVSTNVSAMALSSLTNYPGSSATFDTVAGGTGPFSYQWSKDGSGLASQTNSSLVLSNLSAADAGSYCVVVSGACNSVTECASLTVVPPTNQAVYVISNATFNVSAKGSASLSDRWRFNSTDLTGETASTLTVAKAQPAIECNSAVGFSNSVCSVTNCPGTAAIELTGSTVIISFTSVSNQYYRLERTDDLARNRWVTVADSIPGTSGIVQVAEVGGAGHPSRFYRVLLLPDHVPAKR